MRHHLLKGPEPWARSHKDPIIYPYQLMDGYFFTFIPHKGLLGDSPTHPEKEASSKGKLTSPLSETENYQQFCKEPVTSLKENSTIYTYIECICKRIKQSIHI